MDPGMSDLSAADNDRCVSGVESCLLVQLFNTMKSAYIPPILTQESLQIHEGTSLREVGVLEGKNPTRQIPQPSMLYQRSVVASPYLPYPR